MSDPLSESVLRNVLFEQSSDAQFIYNSQGILQCNPAMAKMLRVSDPEALVGRNPSDFSPQFQIDGSLSSEKSQRIETWVRRHGKHRFDWLFRRDDGDEFVCEVTLTGVRFGAEDAIVGVWREVTDRRIEQEELRRAQTRLQHALRGGDVGLWDWNLATNEVFYSDQWHRQLGETPGTLSEYVDWESRVHPEDLPNAIERVKTLLASSNCEYESSFRMRHASGVYRWILARGQVFRDPSGQPTRLLGVHLDVTAQKEHEQRLNKDLHLSEVMLQTLESTLKVTSLEGLSTIVCQQARRLCSAEIAGMDLCDSLNGKHPIHGRSYSSKYPSYQAPRSPQTTTDDENQAEGTAAEPEPAEHPDDLALCDFFGSLDQAVVLLSADQLRSHPIGCTLCHPTAHRPPLRGVLVCLLSDGKGQTLGAIWLSDKEEGDFDDEDQSILRQLAYIVSTLIVRLNAQVELRRQTELLDESNEELKQFAYVASHDLQQPLRAISNYAEFINEDYGEKLGEEGRRYLQLQIAAAKRMKKLIDDLLQYSRVSRDDAEFTSVNMDEVVQEAMRRLEVSIEETSAVVRQQALPTVRGIESRLCQLMQNLIGNAIKYRDPSRPPVIAISANEQPEHWLFVVEDNGIGIEVKFRLEVFQVFRRLHDGSKIEGTGIGLSLCKRIVQRHGGEIWVEASPDGGCRFCFQIMK
ncbi:multi-sensor signal transduction histidine kinase [Rhodopirellula maiorica SM1]|uniref:histidine kinase n=1 Tax=Rhodopirellula maiorica SM1 TaxID=1265738 RepID=M5RYM5_9BACT|nr:ATP-binding protein [Rhodopirellula maiorica]EMI20502.1 multi-sensor signal transduction histidine kinase [Rhodopirellula maiorica SM1]